MNVAVILIIILIIVLITILYMYFYSNVNNVNSYLDLSTPTGLPKVPSANLIKPQSTTYSYSFWLFINQPNQIATFITRTNEMNIGLNGKDLVLTILDSNPNVPIVIYKMVPSQKWIQVIINRTPTMVECFINGKLNVTQNVSQINNPNYSDITFSKCYAYISNFQRWVSPITPPKALNMYLNGNGYSNLLPSMLLPSVNITASVLQNDVVQKKYSLY